MESEQFQRSLYNRCMNNVVLLNDNMKAEPEEAQYNKQAYKQDAVEKMIACKGDIDHPIDILAYDYTPNAKVAEIPKKKESNTNPNQEAEQTQKDVEPSPAEKSKSPKKVRVVAPEVKQKLENDISKAKEAVTTAEKALAEAKEKLQPILDDKAKIDHDIKEKEKERGKPPGEERDAVNDALFRLTQKANNLDKPLEDAQKLFKEKEKALKEKQGELKKLQEDLETMTVQVEAS